MWHWLLVVVRPYSVVASHKKSGGQGNTILTQRAIVDWSIVNTISCPETIAKIASLYTDGDKKHGIRKHWSAEFFDECNQAKYDVSKVVDRLTTGKPRCPHVIQADKL